MNIKNKDILVICHSYNSFQKDSINEISKYFRNVSVIVRFNPFAEISKYLPIHSFNRYRYDAKMDMKNIPENVNVYVSPVLYLPTDSQYKQLGKKHLVAVNKVIKKNNIQFDFIHSHFTWSAGYVGAELKKTYGVPFFVSAHGNDIYNLPFKDDEWQNKIEYVLNSADYVITVSNSNLSCIRKLNVSTPVKVLPNGYRNDLFHPMDLLECRKTLNLPLDKNVILSVGSLVLEKGYKYLIESMTEVVNHRKDVLCVIVGDGELRAKLEKQIIIAKLQNYVKLVGSRTHDEIPLWINACDIFVLSSLSEGNPTVLFECLGCGKPFVGTKVGGIPEIIASNDHGLLAEPGNSKELAENILFALNQKWNYDKITNFSIPFSWEKVADEIVSTYTNALESKFDKYY